jgi:hypothetical protein
MSIALVEPAPGAVVGAGGLINPPPKFGFFESCLAAVAVGGAAGAATTSLQRGWDPAVAAPKISKSFQSNRQVKLIAPKIKGNTVMRGAQFVSARRRVPPFEHTRRVLSLSSPDSASAHAPFGTISLPEWPVSPRPCYLCASAELRCACTTQYAGVTVAYVFAERMAGGIRGQYDWFNSVPASLAAGVAIGMKKGCAPTAFGMAGAIFWTNYICKEAGSGGVDSKDAGSYFYYGAGDAGRERWAAGNKAERESWLKAPYKAPGADGDDDY